MILYEDKDIIVCHKAAGLPVQSARIGQKDMVSILNNYLSEPIYVVHRLDQPVEGVLVFAKNKKAAAGLSRQITDGSMKKIYQAVCRVTDQAEKQFELDEGKQYTLVDYLVKNGKTNHSSVAQQGSRDAKRAELSFQIRKLKPYETIAEAAKIENAETAKAILAEIHLKTGRHHQIRVQMSHAGLPLYGDQKYHEGWENYIWNRAGKAAMEHENEFTENPGKQKSGIGLALCAVSLTFTHPGTGKRMTIQTEPTSEAFQMMQQ
jgi:23S rRNA pseudouridine1911/1915/1917 synthase